MLSSWKLHCDPCTARLAALHGSMAGSRTLNLASASPDVDTVTYPRCAACQQCSALVAFCVAHKPSSDIYFLLTSLQVASACFWGLLQQCWLLHAACQHDMPNKSRSLDSGPQLISRGARGCREEGSRGIGSRTGIPTACPNSHRCIRSARGTLSAVPSTCHHQTCKLLVNGRSFWALAIESHGVLLATPACSSFQLSHGTIPLTHAITSGTPGGCY